MELVAGCRVVDVAAVAAVMHHLQGSRQTVSNQSEVGIAAREEGMPGVWCLWASCKRMWKVLVDYRRLIEGGGCRDLLKEEARFLMVCGYEDHFVGIEVAVAEMGALGLRMKRVEYYSVVDIEVLECMILLRSAVKRRE